MDKRYILIIIIIVICSINLFFIASHSDEVGSASVIVGKYIFSLPENFTIGDISNNQVSLHNQVTGLNVEVYTNQNNNYDFQKKLDALNNSSDVKILSNGTIDVNHVDVDVVYFTSGLNSDNSQVNRSTFIFSKNNASFQIEMRDFNYHEDFNKTVDILNYIVNSIRLNYKK